MPYDLMYDALAERRRERRERWLVAGYADARAIVREMLGVEAWARWSVREQQHIAERRGDAMTREDVQTAHRWAKRHPCPVPAYVDGGPVAPLYRAQVLFGPWPRALAEDEEVRTAYVVRGPGGWSETAAAVVWRGRLRLLLVGDLGERRDDVPRHLMEALVLPDRALDDYTMHTVGERRER